MVAALLFVYVLGVAVGAAMPRRKPAANPYPMALHWTSSLHTREH